MKLDENNKEYWAWAACMHRSMDKDFRKFLDRKNIHIRTVGVFSWAIYSVMHMLGKCSPFYAWVGQDYDDNMYVEEKKNKAYKIEGLFNLSMLIWLGAYIAMCIYGVRTREYSVGVLMEKTHFYTLQWLFPAQIVLAFASIGKSNRFFSYIWNAVLLQFMGFNVFPIFLKLYKYIRFVSLVLLAIGLAVITPGKEEHGFVFYSSKKKQSDTHTRPAADKTARSYTAVQNTSDSRDDRYEQYRKEREQQRQEEDARKQQQERERIKKTINGYKQKIENLQRENATLESSYQKYLKNPNFTMLTDPKGNRNRVLKNNKDIEYYRNKINEEVLKLA